MTIIPNSTAIYKIVSHSEWFAKHVKCAQRRLRFEGGTMKYTQRVLRKHGYPPDKQEKAIQTVIEQAVLLSEEWVM